MTILWNLIQDFVLPTLQTTTAHQYVEGDAYNEAKLLPRSCAAPEKDFALSTYIGRSGIGAKFS